MRPIFFRKDRERLMEIKEFQWRTEQRQERLLRQILNELKGGGRDGRKTSRKIR